MPPTHAQYCDKAVRWLKLPIGQLGPGCNFAISESTGSYNGEIADAFGMRSIGLEQHSVVVEVKMSLADFRADAAKPHRNGTTVGMGLFRYYMAPEGLVPQSELPPGWGLIEVNSRGKPIVRCGHVLQRPEERLGFKRDWSAWTHIHEKDREIALMVRLLDRISDPEALHKKLKAAKNEASKANREAERLQGELRHAQRQYWELKMEMDKIHGRDPLVAKPRAILNVPSTQPSQHNGS